MTAIQTVNPLLHDIRALLASHGHPVPAWSPARTPLEGLYSLLRERAGDDGLWGDLGALTRAAAAARQRPDGALSGEDVDELLVRLRASLGELAEGEPPPLRRWAASAPLAALSGLLLLGAAMGCQPTASDDDDDDDTTATQACEEALEHAIPEAEQDAFCQLVDIIEGSSPNDDVREQLMECLPELSAEQREQLLDAFLEAGEEELAELLETIAFSEMCGWEGDDDTGNDH